ncbi:MAG: hypothetical protein M1812_006426 [Candelaria pacifica]|nr:MAG: hypothetical protein M1812_006426 [Candelaria pacifica]
MADPSEEEAIEANFLARLNALKAPPLSTPKPSTDVDTDLAARFLALNPSSSIASTLPLNTSEASTSSTTYRNPFTVPNEEDGQTVEELLANIGPEGQWSVGKGGEDELGRLLSEAREALPPSQTPRCPENRRQGRGVRDKGHEQGQGKRKEEGSDAGDDADDTEVTEEDDREEREAAEYLEQIMADIEIARRYGTEEQVAEDNKQEYQHPKSMPSPTKDSPLARDTVRDSFSLPTVPATAPSEPVILSKQSSFIELPSAPTTVPTKPSSTPSYRPPSYTDAEIDSWCCICNDNATIRCHGCDDDLYCALCWREGHIGSDAGLDERSHRWEKYTKAK